MRLLVLGGFLGSGKTTIVSQIVRSLVRKGETAAIIENEIGEIGVDQQLVAEAGVRVTPLFGGCVCCQISGSLISASRQIRNELHPDWLIVETTGLALMSGMFELLQQYGDKDIPVSIVTVVDAVRWPLLIQAARDLMLHQLSDVDAILINKCDAAKDVEAVRAQTSEIAQNAAVFTVSAAACTGDEIWEQLSPVLTKKGAISHDA